MELCGCLLGFDRNSTQRELTHAGAKLSIQLGMSKNCWVKSRILTINQSII